MTARKEMHTPLLCEVQQHTTLQWPSQVFCVLIACCPIHLIPQRLIRLNKRETKRSANKCWSIDKAEGMQKQCRTQILLFLHYWYHTRTNPYMRTFSENFAVREVEKWPSLSSPKSWTDTITPWRLKFLFHYNCGMVKNDKERTRDEVRKITLPL